MIREMTEDDIEQVAILDRDLDMPWTQQMLLDTLRLTYTHMYVCELEETAEPRSGQQDRGGRIIGYAGFEQVLDEGNIYNIVVDSCYRRQGYGGQLLEKILEQSQSLSLVCLFLEVNVNNANAIALYAKNGFEVIARRVKYYHQEDGYVMKKIL